MVSLNRRKTTKQIRLNCKKEAIQVIEQKTNLKHIANGDGDKTHEYSFLFDTFEQIKNAVESLKTYNDSYDGVVASEFKVQGLKIDWAVVCWDADLRRKNAKEWEHFNFRGTKWTRRNKQDQKRYLVNSYHFILTRSRQGMIIFVPIGVDEEEDITRSRKYYDAIYEYLIECGIQPLGIT